TSLPGINREIMILDGEIELNHEDHHNIKLKQFEKDSFKGDWTTKSYGKVTDFNLMTNKGCKGELEHIKLNKDEIKETLLDKDLNYGKYACVIYCVSGKVSVKVEENIQLNEQDLLVLITDKNNDIEKLIINNIFTSNSHLVLNRINFN
ncbi:MAG: HutD family protein, partial [Peptostreptococcaceae bacterium]